MVRIKIKKKQTPEEIEKERQQRQREQVGIQDEFQAKGFELVDWMQNNGMVVVGIIAAILMAGFIWAASLLWSNSTNEKASVFYEQATTLLNSDVKEGQSVEHKNKAARALFEKVWLNYPNSKVAGLARLFAAHISFKIGEPKVAIENYKAFIDDASFNNKLRLVGLLGLAYGYDASNEKEKALLTFEDINKEKWYIDGDTVLWEILNLAGELGDKDKAKKASEELIDQYPNSPFAVKAKMHLALGKSGKK
ncbi:tetratricopeptide repeat protein [Sulfobacillus acidophilus]|uniref:Tetratricopeptide repeat protein n=1 Tax=Sulfobacillus acidophilus TaxID=53633 RepID=A0ABS3AV95_9FIRM|nr:tetratricopeptide repeat protein [Sulfobacillus acidophilus]